MQKSFISHKIRHLTLMVSGVAIAASLTACTTYEPSYLPSPLRNQIQVAESIERLELYTRPDGLALSARDRDAVAQFVQMYGRFGDGPLYINVPSNGASGLGAQQAQKLIRQDMNGFGLGRTQIQTGQYQAAHNAPAPVVVSYRRLKTMPEDCRKLGNLTLTSNNQPYDSFGCSQTANLAAMIQDPRQLLEPYAFDSPNSARRMTVYDKYIEGENTASQQPDRQEISAEGGG